MRLDTTRNTITPKVTALDLIDYAAVHLRIMSLKEPQHFPPDEVAIARRMMVAITGHRITFGDWAVIVAAIFIAGFLSGLGVAGYLGPT
jgi:hypothetical protein